MEAKIQWKWTSGEPGKKGNKADDKLWKQK